MFYSSHVLTKKGPLAKIWLAAHMQSKLTKAMIFATDITNAVDSIFSPDAPMALRLTSNLLLGVVRILYRKTKYLLQESSDALANLNAAYRPSTAARSRDLPPASAAASFAAVTLASPVDATLDLPPPAVDLTQLPQRRRTAAPRSYLAADRDITIHEFAGGLSGGILDAFADEPQLERGVEDLGIEMLEGVNEPLVFTPGQRYQPSQRDTPSVRSAPGSVEVTRAAPADDAVREEAPVLSVDRDAVGTPDDMREHQVASQTPAPVDGEVSLAKPLHESAAPMPEDHDDGNDDSAPHPPSGVDVVMDDEPDDFAMPDGPSPGVARISTGEDELELAEEEQEEEQGPQGEGPEPADQGGAPPTKRGRKRKHVLLEDEATELSVEAFRDCLNDTSDLLLRPQARRRGADRVRGRRALTYEDLLARPAIVLAPQLNELFAQSFHIDEAGQVGSPMSDADLVERDGNKDGNKEGEEEATERRQAIETPEKAVTPQKPAKEVVADPDITPHRSEGEVEAMIDGLDLSSRKTDEVPSSPEQGEISDRRLSLGSGVAPMLEEDTFFQDPVLDSDTTKISLHDVAKTRSQVENGSDKDQGNGEADDVNESTISARTHKMQQYILAHLDEDGELNFSEKLATEPGVSRRTVARSFYELLNLSSKKALQLSQDSAYGTIRAKPVQPLFDTLVASGGVE